MSSRSWVTRGFTRHAGPRMRPLRAKELVPFLHQVVIFVRPLVPVGDVRGAGRKRAAVAQIALLYSALRSADPRLAFVPECVFFGRHGLLDVGRRRVIALLGNDDA